MELENIVENLSLIKGHDRIIDPLAMAIHQDRFPHALLLAGPDGIGKMLTARCFSALLLAKGGAPEDEQRHIDRVHHGTHQDCIIVDQVWAAKNPSAAIKIEAIRALEDRVRTGPFESQNLAVIIDPADEMTTAAANALLKTLEEPPPGTYFFLISQTPERLLPTVRSRSHTFRFSPLSDEILGDLLTEQFPDSDPTALKAVIDLADGSIGRAISFLSADHFSDLKGYVDQFLSTAMHGSMLDILSLAELLGGLDKEIYAQFVPMVEKRLSLITRTGEHQGRPLRHFDIKGWIETLDEGKRDLARNANRRLLSEHILWTLRKT
ncbi:hypothetical protein KKF84_20890 [Myxococcota bacterium]|nr:hypothetical protein [Myxococcota bacterium]MBU1537782.1 hypothetical protein [Myxococcota bacterium]